MYRYYILIGASRMIESKHRYQSYSGAHGALQAYLLKMKPDMLAQLTASVVQKISA